MSRRLSSWVERVPRWRKITASLLLLVTAAMIVAGTLLGQDPLVLVLLAVPVVAVPAGALVTSGARPRPERQHGALAAWAEERGWDYQHVDSSLASTWTGAPFDRGSHHATREVLRGAWDGMTILSCTVRWAEPTATLADTTRHSAHLVAVRLPDLHLSPHVDDRPSDRRDQDVVTESSAFNAEWRVRGSDLRTLHGVLHPATMERLMADDLRGTHVQTENDWLLARWPGPTVLDLLDERVAAAVDLAGRIPRHVWQDHGYDPMTARPSEE